MTESEARNSAYERLENQRLYIEELQACLRDCAEDLACELDERWRLRDRYKGEMRAWRLSMEPVERARALLAKLDAQPA